MQTKGTRESCVYRDAHERRAFCNEASRKRRRKAVILVKATLPGAVSYAHIVRHSRPRKLARIPRPSTNRGRAFAPDNKRSLANRSADTYRERAATCSQVDDARELHATRTRARCRGRFYVLLRADRSGNSRDDRSRTIPRLATRVPTTTTTTKTTTTTEEEG